MFKLLFTASLALALAPALHAAQDSKPVPVVKTVEAVQVPAFPNSTCPIMGKPISTRLFTDTKYGRIYICCKACVKDIQADVEHTYRTAYPATQKLENETCPVTGTKIGKDAVRVLLQGRDFSVADKAAAAIAIDDAQATLAKLLDTKLVDVGNATCPITGDAVAKNVIAVIDGRIVRFASAKAVEEAKKEPEKVLAKALELRAKEDRERAEKEKQSPQSTPAGG
ncbi:MAG: hypothetical protein SGI72_02310 [Planctomycetota bacterium]|nr:hypothetical protein [Planctomycetota bacterium]